MSSPCPPAGSTADLLGAKPTAGALAADAPLPDNRLREPLRAVFRRVPAAWRPVTDAFLDSAVGEGLVRFVDQRVRDGARVYPGSVFRALDLTRPGEVRVVIVGQDPYHGAGQAHGLAFSVRTGQRPPPSLRNLLQEVARDTGVPSQSSGDLSVWARQGVLLLNSVLTVEAGLPQSHAGCGWEGLTDALLHAVALQTAPIVFLLWGAAAQSKRTLAEQARHRVLAANHPSPLSARRPPVPFVGCGHFSRTNELLGCLRPDTPPIAW